MFGLINILILAAALVMGGCALSSGVPPPSNMGVCTALRPHFPERVHRTDHVDTKRGAYRRNIAFGSACR